jgi:hypothetical protein
MTISGVNGSLTILPNNFAFNDYQIVNIAYHLDDNVIAGLGTTVASIMLLKFKLIVLIAAVVQQLFL